MAELELEISSPSPRQYAFHINQDVSNGVLHEKPKRTSGIRIVESMLKQVFSARDKKLFNK